MDWIFENLFLIVIIISGIVAFLGDSKKKQEEQKKKQSTPPKQQTPSRQRHQQSSSQGTRTRQPAQRKREQPRAERQVYREEERPDISAGSIEEQQKKQMERLANRYQTSSQEDLENAEQKFNELFVDRKGEEDNPGKAEMKKRVSGNLDGKGLVNGIIMAEVLGQPRAKQPYQSIVQKRK